MLNWIQTCGWKRDCCLGKFCQDYITLGRSLQSYWPPVKSYETVNHYRNPLIPIKMQFFFLHCWYTGHILLSFRQTTCGAIYERWDRQFLISHGILYSEKMLLRKLTPPRKRLNKKWLTKTKHHVEDGLVNLGSHQRSFGKSTDLCWKEKEIQGSM